MRRSRIEGIRIKKLSVLRALSEAGGSIGFLKMEIEEVAKQIVHAAIKVHKALGPGLLESVYQKCLAYELRRSGLKVECEVPVPIQYEDVRIDAGLRAIWSLKLR